MSNPFLNVCKEIVNTWTPTIYTRTINIITNKIHCNQKHISTTHDVY